jgi:predicted nucleotidyltransferase
MNVTELTGNPSPDFSISNAVVFHDTLNPKLFTESGMMHGEVRRALIDIARHFRDFIGVELDVKDITVSGSNAAFSYTPQSDLDLHIVVAVPDKPEFRELLDAKKNVYNARHDIKVRGIDVELYAQDVNQEHHSLGIYSIMRSRWIEKPTRQDVNIDTQDVKDKYKNYRDRIIVVLGDDEITVAEDMWKDIKRMRQAGLSRDGEFGTENLVFKMLRSQGWIEKLSDYITTLQDQELSIEQRQL